MEGSRSAQVKAQKGFRMHSEGFLLNHYHISLVVQLRTIEGPEMNPGLLNSFGTIKAPDGAHEGIWGSKTRSTGA